MKARLVLAMLGIVGAALFAARGRPAPAAAYRSRCGVSRPLSVSVRALGTAVVGQPLTLEVTAHNAGLPGPFECRLRVNDGMLVPLDGDLAWTRDLPPGQDVTWTTRVQPAVADAIPLTAKLRSLTPPYDAMAPREGYLTLYPFDRGPGNRSAKWEIPVHLRVPGRALVTLPGGDRAVLYENLPPASR